MINSLSIRNKKVILVLVAAAVFIPFLIFGIASLTSNSSSSSNNEVLPTKPPLPTFPEAQAVEGELIIQYVQGQEFDNLSESRRAEITEIYEGLGVISQQKAYPEASSGDLSRSYLLRFSEGYDIEVAAHEIYKLPEIEGAQPNTQFGLF